MFDQKKWSIAYIKFKAYYANVPSWIKTEEVAYYHQLVAALEEASGEDLSHFKIPAERVKPKVVGAQRGSFRGGPGRTIYSSESYCDNDFFQSQLDALNEYLKTLAPRASEARSKYDDLHDWQLEELMANRKIKPKRELVNGREKWVAPREYIIAALIKQDAGPSHSENSTTFNIYGSNVNYESPGATITSSVGGFSKEEFSNLIEGIRSLLGDTHLDQSSKDEININIGTIELQLNSARPNASILKESLKSVKTILQNAAGSLLASGVLAAVNHTLGKL
jgi:hypothetical protein